MESTDVQPDRNKGGLRDYDCGGMTRLAVRVDKGVCKITMEFMTSLMNGALQCR